MATAPPPRIHTLDGWRAVAILLVIAGHGAHFGQYKDQLWANLWGLGVDIFFVLSGYIITLKFIQEKEKSSTINLSSFYIRRAFRILPLVCAYLGTLCVVSLFVNLLDFHSSEVFGSLFFFRNYQLAATQRGFYTTHFWSLSIEEHFYLVWPALFLWLGNRRSLWFAGIGACTCAAWRLYDCTHPDSWIGRYLPGPDSFYRQIRTDARFDGLLLGCALAILLSREVSVPRVASAALLGPTSFFLVSNYAVWVTASHPGGMYAPTAAGLLTCFAAGLPFYGRDLVSTGLVLTLAFGVPVAVRRFQSARELPGQPSF